jgi:transcriptional regulator with XRE-family HTH domain
MEGIGSQLRAARQRLDLTLREVEERANLLAQKWGNASYRISASWLDRVERENRGFSAAKLIVVSYIYNLTNDQMLALYPGVTDSPSQLEQVASPNTTLLVAAGPLGQHAQTWAPESLMTAPPPADTTLLQMDQGVLPAHYRRGIIGRADRTMEPMLLPGSIVLIDTRRRAIAGRKEWTNDYDRPIYFLFTRTGYFCGFCKLDKPQEYLQLESHPISPEPTEARWRYRREVEVIGTVAAMFTRRAA